MDQVKRYRLEEATESFDFIFTEQFVLRIRERLGITHAIHNLLFGTEEEREVAFDTINFYNQVKEVVIRSGGGDKVINLKIFSGLMTELRIKLEITKAGLGPEKTMRVIEQGLEVD